MCVQLPGCLEDTGTPSSFNQWDSQSGNFAIAQDRTTLCAFQEGHWAILRGLGLGNHPSLSRDATFQNFAVFYVLEVCFFLNQGCLIVEVLWNLGCTETAHAGSSAGTSWVCIIQGHFLLSGVK